MGSCDEIVADYVPLGDHVIQTSTHEPFGSAMIATYSNLSNFSANVIRDIKF
ncbi:hypothetical protein MtrunA17_Chr2g0318621 [Medicago truncatula]|uniref:Uncharacterized protein n=1 Tax=Medicago truncatula TaxID=3880 RepID=A0A396JDQ9_MEDTR|nr:hypothetical protein MtrunA17_Chr2g0318621 [Medicago truncatula]